MKRHTSEPVDCLDRYPLLEIDLAVDVARLTRCLGLRIGAPSGDAEPRGIERGLGGESPKYVQEHLDVALWLA